MKMRLYKYLLVLCAPLLAACDVHQFPVDDDTADRDLNVTLRLKFNTDMKVWEHTYDVNSGTLTPSDVKELPVYDNTQTAGEIRHIVRVYPYAEYNSNLGKHLYEYVFFEDLSDAGYDYETSVSLPQGDYTFMVWSDIVPSDVEEYFHDASEFAQAELVDHRINSDYRDAFRGTAVYRAAEVSAVDPLNEMIEVSLMVEMKRPMAKFEIIADGVEAFLEQEALRNARQGFADYQVAIAYAGYVPYAYNILTDGIVDSKYREVFMSSPVVIDGNSASLGFDYSFIRNDDTSVPVQIGIYDASGEEIASSDPIQIPLRRDHHTVVRGKFFEAHSSGGSLGIDPDYDGEFNIIR